MTTSREIHLLSQELIPVLNEVDTEPKQIVLDHIDHCEVCQELYAHANEYDKQFPEADVSSDVDIKPLKKLAQF